MSKVLRLHIRVEARQQLLLGSGPQVGNHRESNDRLPATTLRGSLAALWLRDFGDPTDEFHELFGGSLRWPTLLPNDHVIAPLSVAVCKYQSQPECSGFAIDRLEPDADHEASCPSCEGPTEMSKGRLVPVRQGAAFRKVTTTTTELTEQEVAKSGDLFSRDGLAIGSVLVGTTTLRPTLSAGAKEWIRRLEGRSIRLGGRASVAGQATIRSVTLAEETVTSRFAQGDRLAIRVQTPAVVLDSSGAPSTRPGDLLASSTLDGKVTLVDRGTFIRTTTTAGWNALAGVPRPQEVALDAGSTVLVTVTEPSGLSSEQVAEFLVTGVGIRSGDGLGLAELSAEPWTPGWTAGANDVHDQPTPGTILTFLSLLDGQGPGQGPVDQEMAKWFRKQFLELATVLRNNPAADRQDLRTEKLKERSLRDVPRPVEEAYGDVIADSAVTPTELESAARELDVLSFSRAHRRPNR